MINKCKIARCLSVLICMLYISSPIYAFSTITKNNTCRSNQKIIFQNFKKEASTVIITTEENEEELDSFLYWSIDSTSDFIFLTTDLELSAQEKTIIQTKACKFHLPLWLDVRHILQ